MNALLTFFRYAKWPAIIGSVLTQIHWMLLYHKWSTLYAIPYSYDEGRTVVLINHLWDFPLIVALTIALRFSWDLPSLKPPHSSRNSWLFEGMTIWLIVTCVIGIFFVADVGLIGIIPMLMFLAIPIAGIICLLPISLGMKLWDYMHRRRYRFTPL